MPNIIAFLALTFISFNCYATSAADNDYYSNSYEERKVTFKIKPSFAFFLDEQYVNMPSPNSSAAQESPQPLRPLISYGMGVEAGATLFFTEYLTSELSLGMYSYKVNERAIKSFGYNYSDNPLYTDNKNVYTLPVTAIFQLLPTPYSSIRPYIGAGLMGTLMYTNSKDFSIKPSWGGVMQLGIDFLMRNENLIGVEVKKYFALTPRIHYHASMLGQEVFGRVGISPLVISVNFGLTF